MTRCAVVRETPIALERAATVGRRPVASRIAANADFPACNVSAPEDPPLKESARTAQ